MCLSNLALSFVKKKQGRITLNELNVKRYGKVDSKTGGVFNRASQNSYRVLPSDDAKEKLDTRLLYDFNQGICNILSVPLNKLCTFYNL